MAGDSTHAVAPFVITASGTDELTYAELRTKRFRAPTRGVRISTSRTTEDLEMQCAEYLPVVPPGAVFARSTAARLHGLILPPDLREAEKLVISTPAHLQPARRNGLNSTSSQLPTSHTCLVRDLPVTSIARTLFDIAPQVAGHHLLASADDALRRELCTQDDLVAVAKWAKRRRGIKAFRRIAEWANPNAGSPPESVIRYWVLDSGIAPPACNADIFDDAGQWLARGDLVWFASKLLVEYDGLIHLDKARWQYDQHRRNRLQDAGWTMVVLTSRDLRVQRATVAAICRALTSC